MDSVDQRLPCLGGLVVSVSDSWPGGCEFETRTRYIFFPAYFRLSPLLKHVRKVVGGFERKLCYYWSYHTDHHHMTLAVKVALNPDTTNQGQRSDCMFCAAWSWSKLAGQTTIFVKGALTANSLPKDNILDWSKVKAFADDKYVWKIKACFGTGRKHCGKRRKCWLQAFSPSPTMFSNASSFTVVKKSRFWSRS